MADLTNRSSKLGLQHLSEAAQFHQLQAELPVVGSLRKHSATDRLNLRFFFWSQGRDDKASRQSAPACPSHFSQVSNGERGLFIHGKWEQVNIVSRCALWKQSLVKKPDLNPRAIATVSKDILEAAQNLGQPSADDISVQERVQ